MRKVVFYCFIFLLSFSALDAQATLRGSVRDSDNGQALIGAAVQLTDINRGTTTDSLGNFRFEGLTPGRYPISIKYLGYQQLKLQEVLVSSGKEQVLDLFLQEAATSLTAITVKASRSPQGSSDANIVRISQEETLRFPASFSDPARLVLAYPGVSGADDQANLLIVRGQSPLGMQWRMEGLEIVNPNHTPNAGTFSDRSTTSGGGVNALSSQLLEEANFYLGSFPASFSNATAGLLDMRFRKGNNERREYTFQAGLLGLDLAAEGPISQNKSAYLVNYRYSFTGLLSDLGVPLGDEDIRFQDVSYHLSFPSEDGRQLKVFGLSGGSSNKFKQPEDSNDWETEKDLYRSIDFASKTNSHGFSWTKPQKDKGLWRVAGMLSWLTSERSAIPSDEAPKEEDSLEERRSSLQFSYRRKLLPFGSVKIGIEGVHLDQSSEYIENDEKINAREKDGLIVSPYVDWRYQIKKVNLSLGYRSSIWLNWPDWIGKNVYGEPRLSAGYAFSKKNSIQFDYSVSSQASSVYAPAFMPRRMKQSSLSWVFLLNTNRKLKLQFYQQQLSQIAGVGALSELNQLNQFLADNLDTSEGRNQGAEISLQQFATGGWWYVVSAAVFDARYRNEQEEWVKSRFAQDYTSSITLGKEWSGSDHKKSFNRFGFNVALRLNGGLRTAPVLVEESRENRTTVYDYDAGFEEQLPAYFRGDLRIYFQKNRENWSSILSLDIQNFTGQENTAYRYYDRFLDAVTTRYQLEFIPLLSYRINF